MSNSGPRFGPIDPMKIEALARRLADNLPESLASHLPDGINTIKDELEQNLRSTLNKGMDKLDLVTREEFEVQTAVLARTRQKLEALEARLNELEQA